MLYPQHTIRLPDETWELIEQEAKRHHLTVSAWFRQWSFTVIALSQSKPVEPKRTRIYTGKEFPLKQTVELGDQSL